MKSGDGPTLVVADASVLAGWALPDEEINPGSLRLKNDIASRRVTLLEPPLIMQELASALSVAVRRRRISTEDAVQAWEAFLHLGMVFGPVIDAEASALKMSFAPGITAYDASYIALAESQGCIFYTADRRLATTLSRRSETVRMISEYVRHSL